MTREIIAQKLADLDGYYKPQPWNYEAADAILALSPQGQAERDKVAANFLRQTRTPLVGRTDPTVSWFGTPAERDVILSALRAMPLQDHADKAVIYRQVQAVLEAARRANTQLTDCELIFVPGDWRVKKVKEYGENLAGAVKTLEGLLGGFPFAPMVAEDHAEGKK